MEDILLPISYSKTCLKRPLSNDRKKKFKTNYRLMKEHSVILLTFIRLKFVIKIFVVSILSDRFTQVLLYSNIKMTYYETSKDGISNQRMTLLYVHDLPSFIV